MSSFLSKAEQAYTNEVYDLVKAITRNDARVIEIEAEILQAFKDNKETEKTRLYEQAIILKAELIKTYRLMNFGSANDQQQRN